jgi:hypothetical protein
MALRTAMAAAPIVSATLEPQQISVGQSAELTITTLGAELEPVSLPVVAGLQFRIVSQFRRTETINRGTLTTTSVVVRVTPKAAGTFTIPGVAPKSQPLVLRVAADTGAPVPGSPSAGAPPPQGSAPGAATSGIHLSADGSAFVQLIIAKQDFYVGQIVPVQIELGFRPGYVTALNGPLALTGNEFTLNKLSPQAERSVRNIDGKQFGVLTWHSVLAPVRPGKFPLSIEIPLTVRISTRPQRESLLDDLLGDPFMQNHFGATISKDIKVTSPPAELAVQPLPALDRPAGFSGAVGTFKIASELATRSAAVGDPLTLRLHVTGSGNFDRVDSNMLEHLDGWKSYPPTSVFKPSDATGDKGEKTFEQPLIATKPGAQNLPEVAFSYFDPAIRRYETVHTEPLTVQIVPAAADRVAAPPAQPHAEAVPAAIPTTAQLRLRPDHPAAGAAVNSLVPLFLRPAFLAVPTSLALLFAGAWFGVRGRVTRAHASGQDPVMHVLGEIEAASRAGDAALFFTLAREAVSGIDERLGSGSEEARELAALIEEAKYSLDMPSCEEVVRWTQLVQRRLRDGRNS